MSASCDICIFNRSKYTPCVLSDDWKKKDGECCFLVRDIHILEKQHKRKQAEQTHKNWLLM